MKVAAYLATLFIRLLGMYIVFASAVGLIALTGTPSIAGTRMSLVNDRMAIVLVLQLGLGSVAAMLAGRVVRLLTADAPLGHE